MTFAQYIDNPMGKSNAVFSQREMFKAQYSEKFGKVMVKENGSFAYNLFFDKIKDEYYCVVKVPSETADKFYYDVVIKFHTKDNGFRTEPSLKNYDVQFFSNDPAFVYTYAYVFAKNDMLIMELKQKASKMSLKKPPDERNYYQTPGYVKSIYFAYLFMQSRNLFVKNTYKAVGQPYNKGKLNSLVEDTDTKLAERDDAGKRLAQQKKIERQKRIDLENEKKAGISNNTKIVKKSSNIKNTSSVSTSKRVNKIKQIRKK